MENGDEAHLPVGSLGQKEHSAASELKAAADTMITAVNLSPVEAKPRNQTGHQTASGIMPPKSQAELMQAGKPQIAACMSHDTSELVKHEAAEPLMNDALKVDVQLRAVAEGLWTSSLLMVYGMGWAASE